MSSAMLLERKLAGALPKLCGLALYLCGDVDRAERLVDRTIRIACRDCDVLCTEGNAIHDLFRILQCVYYLDRRPGSRRA
ncbi:hypothetical protein [Labrys wisconsinensis]|uniref:Uncharacterized protein n=1 Tax=Labrys wisconsinensis TaxID=425677 RepID=A0ABU0JHB5_9HYPH|nr:hypothetical protein [Labrys wisconsinensis]MDQ0473682.1 hypothetical protein [Labrys wisconsinensis]